MVDDDTTAETTGSTDGIGRRRYLAVAGLATATGLAGCNTLSGGGGTDDGGGDTGDGTDGTATAEPVTVVEGPATFPRVGIEGPAEATVGEEVTFTVTATNAGSEAGTFEGTLTAAEGAQQVGKSVSIADVPSGETGSTEVSVTFELADTYVLAVSSGAADATHELPVGAATGAVGEAFDLGNGLRVTLSGVEYETGVFYTNVYGTGAEGTAFYAPAGDQVLGVLRFAVENTSTDARTFGANLSLGAGEFLVQYPKDDPIARTRSVDGSTFTDGAQRGTEIRAGQRVDGWLLAQLPRADATSGFAVGWQRDATGTAPEREWRVDGSTLPSFAVAELTLPNESAPGPVEYALTVRNEGDADGTFRGQVERGNPDADGLRTVHRLERAIPAGGSHTFEFAEDWPWIDDRKYRVRPLGTTHTVDFFAPSLAVGDELVTQYGSVAVTAVETGQQLTVRDGKHADPHTETPDRGRFVFVEVEFARDSTDHGIPARSFTFSADGTTYGQHQAGGKYENFVILEEPISGRQVTGNTVGGDAVPVGDPKRAWLIYDVPTDVTPATATLTYETSDGPLTSEATWKLG